MTKPVCIEDVKLMYNKNAEVSYHLLQLVNELVDRVEYLESQLEEVVLAN